MMLFSPASTALTFEADASVRKIQVLNESGRYVRKVSVAGALHLLSLGGFMGYGHPRRIRAIKATNHMSLKTAPRPAMRESSNNALATSVASWQSRMSAESIVSRREASGIHSAEEWASVVSRCGNKCLRCGVSGTEVTLTKDHIVPISMGGHNFASNLQPLCLQCNSWKGDREIDFRGSMAYASPAVVPSA